ncbi:plasma alpha-L-fucosidase-like [Panonychus citri]|uniref:plasma alpha-L-fucosidase-like n=1 Tax=Panonychus citri TaxID=50023 RepID=UPI002306E776|nr:plasma alpha-L-fucosidase-like [Panonychus citri]
MDMKYYFLLISVFLSHLIVQSENFPRRYKPTWESIDSRPLPEWYDNAKVGIFIHWGVFSVPARQSEWFWWDWKGLNNQNLIDYMVHNFKPNFTYAEFAPMFTARHYNPDHWTSVFKHSGARYVVMTSKHHEGFTLWPSKTSWNWNAMDVGPKRDLVGELATAIRKTDLRFGLYHSLYEWFNPLFLADQANNFTTQAFVHAKTIPELYDIVNTYRPEIIWSDGDWNATDDYWTSRDWITWLYNESPVRDTVVTNDRWGSGVMCNHGGFLTCQDRYQPGTLQTRKWESTMTIDRHSWGYVRTSTAADYLTYKEIITSLVKTVSYGGNLLINIGPTAEGTLPPIMEERLRQMGAWLKVNGEAIYHTQPWVYQNDSLTRDVYYTEPKYSDDQTVFAIFLEWPITNRLELGSVNGNLNKTQVSFIGPDGTLAPLVWTKRGSHIIVHLNPVISDFWGWVIVLTHVNPL